MFPVPFAPGMIEHGTLASWWYRNLAPCNC